MLSGGTDCVESQNAGSLNQTNLYFIQRSVLHELSTSLNEKAHFQKEGQTGARMGARSIMGSFGGHNCAH